MTATNTCPVQSGATNVGLFLAHALELESEAAERYQEMADSLDAHNQPEVAEMFRELCRYATMHRDEIRQTAAGHGEIPKVAPWEFDWGPHEESPEAASWEDTHYLMTPHHALLAALSSERQSRDYYEKIAAETKDPEVHRLAAEFAEEEAGHVALVEKWLTKHPEPEAGWDDDPDPPNISD